MKKDRWEKVKKAYQEGKPVKEICMENDISKQTLYNNLRAEELPLRNIKLHEGLCCPLFNQNLYGWLQCEVRFSAVKKVTLFFENKDDCKAYKKQYCMHDYPKCPLYYLEMRSDGKEDS